MRAPPRLSVLSGTLDHTGACYPPRIFYKIILFPLWNHATYLRAGCLYAVWWQTLSVRMNASKKVPFFDSSLLVMSLSLRRVIWWRHTFKWIMNAETFQPGPPDLTRMRGSPSEVKFNIGIRIVYLPSAFVQREASVGFFVCFRLMQVVQYLVSGFSSAVPSQWSPDICTVCHAAFRYRFRNDYILL